MFIVRSQENITMTKSTWLSQAKAPRLGTAVHYTKIYK